MYEVQVWHRVGFGFPRAVQRRTPVNLARLKAPAVDIAIAGIAERLPSFDDCSGTHQQLTHAICFMPFKYQTLVQHFLQ